MSWSPQWEEERDYWPQSELQNLYQQSQREAEPDDSAKIEAALAKGRHVLIESHPRFCPFTDGQIGDYKALVGTYDTDEEAEADLKRRYPEGGDYDPDVCVYIRPYRPAPPPPPPTPKPGDDRDEIPF